ncbi:hypothetical protein IAT40_004394 [Kwoniella sp. CBS 6097]
MPTIRISSFPPLLSNHIAIARHIPCAPVATPGVYPIGLSGRCFFDTPSSFSSSSSSSSTKTPSSNNARPSVPRLQHQRRSQLNLLAHFKPPPPRTPLRQVLSSQSQSQSQNDDCDSALLPESDQKSKNEHTEKGLDGMTKDAFETSSTSPAGTSFQDVPKPPSPSTPSSTSSSTEKAEINGTKGTKVVEPVPAMKDPSTTSVVSASEKGTTTRTREVAVQGVMVPPKPIPPGEEDCCMSGCVHCVYTIYADDLETYSEAIVRARTALLDAEVPQDQWPIRDELVESSKAKEANAKSTSTSDGKVKEADQIVAEETEKMESGMDPTMSAFLAFENKLKKKQAPESSAAS